MDAHYMTLSASIDRMNRTPNFNFTRGAAEIAHARAAAKAARGQKPSLMDSLMSAFQSPASTLQPVNA
jgi:hypothetical protein